MRFKLLACFVLAASMSYAKDVKIYRTGKLLQIDSVQCSVEQKHANSVPGDMSGAHSAHRKAHELHCQEYVLQTDGVIYRIRAKDEKHQVLLPVGQSAKFRLVGDDMLLRPEGLRAKEREYVVVSTTPRGNEKAEAKLRRVNHLQ